MKKEYPISFIHLTEYKAISLMRCYHADTNTQMIQNVLSVKITEPVVFKISNDFVNNQYWDNDTGSLDIERLSSFNQWIHSNSTLLK